MKRVAVIDLGTNTFHLLVVDVDNKKLQILHKEKQSVKIGEGGISQGVIAPPAQKRALDTLHGFRQKISDMGVDQVFATATSAFRNAANGKELVLKIFEETGIEVRIIDGKTEAQYIFQGVRQALDIGTADSLILDIGGGSIEFIIANNSAIRWMESFEIGAQRLMDQFHHQDPISRFEIERLESYLDQRLGPLQKAMERFKPKTLIGSSGTFDTLSQIYCLSNGISKPTSPEQPLTPEGFKLIHNEIIHKNRSERLAIPGMIEMRADMIVVATSLIDYLLKRFQITQIRVSSYALKEGMLFEVSNTIRQ
ncbi:MAG: hypothetical protein DHS20C17_05140 [Cyclobacteriaceae bacterium]|nr:MAG: hypothetical protein DHS20C17_05140 [Cyclobacteriaceae bacterium]